MRILLDESLPRGLKRLLQGLDIVTVPERGWQGVRNGELLKVAGQEFSVFLTADRNLEYQQNLPELTIGIVVLVAASNPSVPTWLRHLTPRLIRVQGGEMRPLGSSPQ